jgi:hypothetical protein
VKLAWKGEKVHGNVVGDIVVDCMLLSGVMS